MLGSDTLAFDSEIPEGLNDDDLAKGEWDSQPREVTVLPKPKPKGKWSGESMYPKLLQGELLFITAGEDYTSSDVPEPELIVTVLSREAFLFSDLERAHLQHLSSLPCMSRALP